MLGCLREQSAWAEQHFFAHVVTGGQHRDDRVGAGDGLRGRWVDSDSHRFAAVLTDGLISTPRTSWPAWTSSVAMGRPMFPRPIHVITDIATPGMSFGYRWDVTNRICRVPSRTRPRAATSAGQWSRWRHGGAFLHRLGAHPECSRRGRVRCVETVISQRDWGLGSSVNRCGAFLQPSPRCLWALFRCPSLGKYFDDPARHTNIRAGPVSQIMEENSRSDNVESYNEPKRRTNS